MAKLGEICTIVSGSTPKTSVASYWDGNIKWITPAELNEDTFYIMDSVRHITEEGKEKNGLSYLPIGTVILSSRAPIGKTAIAGCEMCCNQGFKNLICSDAIYNEYLYFFLKSKADYLNSLGRGATFKEISKSIVESIEIPLPEVNQQKEIAEKFKKLEQLISLRKQQLEKLDELVKARFVEMFGDPIRNEKGWNTYTLAEMCDGIGDGLHGTPEYDENGEYPFINGNNLISGIIQINPSTKKVNKKTYEKHYIKISQNAILLSINGTLGRIAFYNSEQVMLGKSACYCNLRDEVNRIFVYNIMKTDAFARYLEDNATKSTIKNVGLKAIREYRLIMPPIPLQNRFSSFVERVDQQKQTVQQSLEKLELMKKALMQEYFG